ncbi:MAG: citrate synthase [Halobacteriales archaeon SW_9_67_25]|jgi:citrate synthase|nr:MAG: citrate synthase [Halobacteriales archaeon SW_9_67_25]
MAEELQKGLDGVLVAESALSDIDGDEGRLIYRGYDIEDLARGATYEEVLYLLWHGRLPDRGELEAFGDTMSGERTIDEEVMRTVRALAEADTNPMAALKTAVSMLPAYDPAPDDIESTDREITFAKGRRVTAKMPTIVAAFTRARRGEDPVEPREDLGHAANFLYMLTGREPDDVAADVFDQALVLHADHGLNASTFSALVTASTLSDVHSAVTSAVGTLKGPLHGGANQDVMEMLKEIDDSEMAPVEWVETALAEDRRVAGFGHRVYNVKDPRAKILGERSRELGEAAGSIKWYEMSTAIEEYVADRKRLAPNVDFYSASTYYQMGIPVDIYTPIFAMSRVGGWVAHMSEYIEDNRLIRPRARYVGSCDCEFVPVDER